MLVVLAKDEQGVEVDEPMEIHVTVTDENDNAPECGVSEFEVQENEVLGKNSKHSHLQMTHANSPVIAVTMRVCFCFLGSVVGNLMAHDADDENSANALLAYKLLTQNPPTANMFSVDEYSGAISVSKSGFRRSVTPQYTLTIFISDGGTPGTHTDS